MVKFLPGGTYDGTAVPVCTYWREDVTTNKAEDYARIVDNPGSNGSCIANAYFLREDITCFNDGNCNSEGKCLPCGKYKYGGMRLGISHSPPTSILRQFDKGLTDEDIKSPNLVKFPTSVVTQVQRDQLPFHLVLRNVQATIAKCCHWNQGDGIPTAFYLATIIDGPDFLEITNLDGSTSNLKGIVIKHAAFPDEVGTFVPVGTPVVAGWDGQPFFYLEPRTGLVKPGQGVIFSASGEGSPVVRTKQAAAACSRPMIDVVNATRGVCNEIIYFVQQASDYYNSALNTNVPEIVDAALAKLEEYSERRDTACDAADEIQTLGNTANSQISAVLAVTDAADIPAAASALQATLYEIADLAETAASVGTGGSSSQKAAGTAGVLRRYAAALTTSSSTFGTKCEYFFAESNVAEQWNTPEDGSLPCNGIRTDCQFYTGEPWQYATDEKMEVGQKITGQALQEIRFRSADWTVFTNPEQEFRKRFSTPFIWAFSGYVSVGGTPDIEDMILYRPKVLYGYGTDVEAYETVQVKKIAITDFDTLSLSETVSNIQPGSEVLDQDQVPSFPTKISIPTVPTSERLQITHPPTDGPFKYRTWSPAKNFISIFGVATPNSQVYLVNLTALTHRDSYNNYADVTNFVDGLPSYLPGAPDFTPGSTTAAALLTVFRQLEEERTSNPTAVMLGFDKVDTSSAGFWSSLLSVDLVHNNSNEIYAFYLQDDVNFLVDKVVVDYTFMHAIPVQTSFTGLDFTMHDSAGGSKTGIMSGDITKKAEIQASYQQIVGNEAVGFSYGYYGLRFKDRNLRFGTLNADTDLIPDESNIADEELEGYITEAAPSQFVSGVGYNVVQYRKSNLLIENWYLINDCGLIMIVIPDVTANRVLPLGDQSGSVKALTNVLVNGGGKGSIVAQFALESAELTIGGETKKLVQHYKSADGVGLPANYVILAPSPEVENAFGRPSKDMGDSITITYTYLQAQTTTKEGTPGEPAQSDEVVNDNFYGDTLRPHFATSSFDGSGSLTVGGQNVSDAIRSDQQEYVWVFTDSDGRPIGRKYTRLLTMYANLSCINIEILYSWNSTCTTYGLKPDANLIVGQNNGTVTIPPKGTINPEELQLGFRVANLLGERECGSRPNCATHEFSAFGPLLQEFEVIVEQPPEEGASGGEEAAPILKAVFPNAGQQVTGTIVSSRRPGEQFLKKSGPMWYPYTSCERPRYNFRTNGPLHTDSTELINQELKPAGLSTGANVLEDNQVRAASGVFGGLMRQDMEAYQGPNRVVPKILDIHPSLRACSQAYTNGNQVLTGRTASFSGYARKRGEVDLFWYTGLGWQTPPFGNFGRNRLLVEVSSKRGDFVGGANGKTVGFRWMPMYPEREDLGAGIGLFTEDLEPQHYRLLAVSHPGGSVGETVNENIRYTHKQLIQNRIAAAIEYPYVPYYPTFLPDAKLGSNPEDRTDKFESGPISTLWAWREQEKPIRRGIQGNTIKSLVFTCPDYILDQRRMETQIRPDEGPATITFTAPEYDSETGELLTNASISLNSGPPREIVIDFVNKKLEPATQENTVYDSAKVLGDDPFPCTDGTLTDNPLMETPCSCISDANDPALEGPPAKLPAIFQHLDALAPDGYVVVYESEEMQKPFSIPLSREAVEDPCCMCVYYIRGIYFKVLSGTLPSAVVVDPAFNSGISMQYTWSRVPHGLEQGQGTDGAFNATENMADNYISHSSGDVLTNRFIPGITALEIGTDAAAIFPSRERAALAIANETPIDVAEIPASEIKAGGIPATDGISRGEDEAIVLDFKFDTFAKILDLKITFFAGKGWEVPQVVLGAVYSNARTGPATLRSSVEIARSTLTANGAEVPNSQDYDAQVRQEGLDSNRGVPFVVTLQPAVSDQPFWNQYAQEYHLVFLPRGGTNCMGIAGIEMSVEAMLPGAQTEETIFIPARKYYISQGAVTNNPEEFLQESDSATVYWRSTDAANITGANKFRAYSWGEKIEDDQAPMKGGDVKVYEGLQELEYDIARDLFARPYVYTFTSYSPKEERAALEFYGGHTPSWTLTMTADISKIDEVKQGGDGNLIFGTVPKDRNIWHAPGHAWTFKFEESYVYCCRPCPNVMVVDYNYAHLHDNLGPVETARFWDELPTGLTRLLRSTMGKPDPTFGQRNQSGVGIDGSHSGQAVLMDVGLLTDGNGDPIPLEVTQAAGVGLDDDGNPIIVDHGGL